MLMKIWEDGMHGEDGMNVTNLVVLELQWEIERAQEEQEIVLEVLRKLNIAMSMHVQVSA